MTPRHMYIKIQVPPGTQNSLYKVTPMLLYEMVFFVRNGLFYGLVFVRNDLILLYALYMTMNTSCKFAWTFTYLIY